MYLDAVSIMFIVIAIIVVTAFLIFMYFLYRSVKGKGDPEQIDRMSPAKPYPEKVFKKEETSNFCRYCGAKFTEELIICPECGEQLN